ncbi:hypothetical protein ACJX0J_020239, partial [Zea mays]
GIGPPSTGNTHLPNVIFINMYCKNSFRVRVRVRTTTGNKKEARWVFNEKHPNGVCCGFTTFIPLSMQEPTSLNRATKEVAYPYRNEFLFPGTLDLYTGASEDWLRILILLVFYIIKTTILEKKTFKKRGAG